jgi:hypothetical protein
MPADPKTKGGGMRVLGIAILAVMAGLWVGCTSTGDFEPIVVDLSKNKPAAATPVAPTATPGIVPAPTAEPPAPPVPTPVATAPPPATAPPSAAPQRTPRPAPPLGPEAVAHAREEAFNRHDLDSLAALYAPDARVFEPPDRLRDSGAAAIRESYARSFSMAPGARVRVTDAMTEGNLTVVRETQTGVGAGPASTRIRILEVRDGRIAVEWILR